MCGIAGIYNFNNSKTVKESELAKMRDTLIHRGPDDAGFYVSPDKKVGFGTRRLKIIDLSEAGHMPMNAGSAWITYNGEIYNFKELRAELAKKGYEFKSKTDTEVILNSYLEYGFDCVKKFNGMFAFAIWDEKKQVLFAARDHVGIKPFYWAIQNGAFYFGSEIKAILAHPDFKKELDETGISHYLTFSSLPAPRTMFKGIKKLQPATYIAISKSGKIKEISYWNPIKPTDHFKKESEWAEETRELLKKSIKSQMVSDVPFGCFLSGGIDSSTNAKLMSEALGKPVETFSIGSKTFGKYNEFEHSRMMAKELGAETREISIGDEEALDFVEKYPFYADDPNADQVCLPLFYLSKLTRDSKVTMIQVGEGSDEIFSGYPVYLNAVKLYEKWWVWLKKMPSPIKKLLQKGGNVLSHPKFEFHKEYLRRLAENQEPFWGYAIAFSDYQKERLLGSEFKKRISLAEDYSIVKSFYDEIDSMDGEADFLKRITYLEIKNRLPEVLLMRTDKMTMAHSIEARVPFLDKDLVEMSLQIPESAKIRGGDPKHVLKMAVKGIIPDEIINRKKQGFAAPMSEWLKPESKISEKLLNIVRNSKIKERNFFNGDYVEKLISAHQNKGVENNFRIWNLITLSLWYDYWFK